MNTSLKAVSLAIAGFAINTSALAQDHIADAEVSGEIVVTARRVAENLQTTPVSVAIFDDSKLQASAVTDLGDVTRLVPGVRFQGQGSIAFTEVTMRGLGQTTVGTGGPAVQVYVADVPLTVVTNLPTFDLANVQVLRGPQGTLFGRNTIGGAILLTPAPPTFDFEGYVSAAYGSYDNKTLETAVNIPLVDDIAALRVAGQVRRRDGYVKNLGVGGRFGDVHYETLRASLLLQPFDGLTNTTVATYFHRRENGAAPIPFEANINQPFYPFLAPVIQTALNLPHHVTNNDNPDVFVKNDDWAIVNTTSLDLSDSIKVKNIFGYQHSNMGVGLSSDGLPVPVFNLIRVDAFDTLTNELQLAGGLFEDKLDWILGGYYSKTDPGGNNLISIFGTNIINQLKSRNKALYANVSYDLTDKLRLNAGVRYSWDSQRGCFQVTAGGLANASSLAACEANATSGGPPNGQGIAKTSSRAPTWTVGIDYQATDDLFFYLTSRRGYRSGGLNTPLFNTACTTGSPLCDDPATPAPADGAELDLRSFQAIKNEYLTDVEVGLRSEPVLFGQKHRFNVSAFRYIWENVAGFLPIICQPGDLGCPGTPSIGYNAGKVRAFGVEAELLLNLSQSLKLSFNGAYTDQKQVGTRSAPAGFNGAIPPANLAAPKWAGTVGIDYSRSVGADSDLRLHFEYFRTVKYQAQNNFVPGYGLGNASLGLTNIGGSGLDATFWVRNVFDAYYIVAPVIVDPNQFPVKAALFGEPRTVGLELTYRFGK